MSEVEQYPPNQEDPSQLTLVTWNILLDKTRTDAGIVRSPSDRLPSQIGTLQALRKKLGVELDAVAIQEAHKDDLQHNGELLSEALGYGTGQWIEHNKKPFPESKTGRAGEYVGLFGARIDYAEPIELGDHRRAIFSMIGETAIVGIHPRAGKEKGALQEEQVGVVLKVLQKYPNAVLLGDFNNRPGGEARLAIQEEGFEDSFSALGKRHLPTYPTFAYRRIMRGSKQKPASPLAYLAPGYVLDSIYVRGLTVHAAGKFVGDSDHAGLWAKVSNNTAP